MTLLLAVAGRSTFDVTLVIINTPLIITPFTGALSYSGEGRWTTCCRYPLSKCQRLLRQRVGLRQRRDTCLHQDLVLSEDGRLECDIGIADPRLCSREVFTRDLQVGNRGLKPVLNRPVFGSGARNGADRIVNIR